MTKSQLDRIEAMLGSLLKSDNLLQWVGYYAHGRTSTGDPYIVLFPESDKLEQKVCRVYPSQFKKLIGLCDTNVPNSVRKSKSGPTKAQAQPTHKSFQVLLGLGKETQMGREKRFVDVLRTWDRPKPAAPVQPAHTVDVQASSPPPEVAYKLADALIANMIAAGDRTDVADTVHSVCFPIDDTKMRDNYAAMAEYYKRRGEGVEHVQARRAAVNVYDARVNQPA